jgi:methyl-accepting chemotaxis protein
MFKHMKIASRLKLLGIIVVIFTLALAALGYSMVTRMSSSTSEMYNKGLVGSKLLSDANNSVWELRYGASEYMLADPSKRKEILEGRPKLYGIFEESLKKYADSGASKEQDAAFKELLGAYRQYKDNSPHWFELINAGKMEEAAEFRTRVTKAAGIVIVKQLKTLIEGQLKINEKLKKEASATADEAHNLLAIMGGMIFVIIAGFVFFLARSIIGPLSQMQATMEKVQKSSDFTQRIEVVSNDEIGKTATAFNDLISSVQATLREVLDSASKVSEAAFSLSASSSRVAARSEQQSEAAAAMAAAVEQVTVSINHVSESAKEALKISINSGDLSSQGGDIIHDAATEMMKIADTVRQTSNAIEELGQQSTQISSIVQVIRDVAEQTNLLALNAAIEAARAGEQGRGFAVVADEVRKLAERTTKATEEISNMTSTIQSSARMAVVSTGTAVSQVEGGVALAQQGGDAINQIKDGAGQVIGVVNEISSALIEQGNASNDIAAHVEKVAQMTEENSAAAAETAGAANNLEKLADTMRAAVGKFKV